MLLFVFMMLCGAVTPPDLTPQEHAILLQGEATAEELNGAPEHALVLLRQAHAMVPDDPSIAFDLARLSYQLGMPSLEQDAADFLRMPATTPEAQLLRGYLLSARRDLAGAQAEFDDVLRTHPQHTEALQARTMLDALAPAKEGSVLSARLRLSGEVDSNVELLPQDQPSNLMGVRSSLNATLRAAGAGKSVEGEGAASVRGAFHLNDRNVLQPYDVASGVAWGRLQLDTGPVLLGASAVGMTVFAGEHTTYFMNDAYGQLEARIPVGRTHLGLYGVGGKRWFNDGNDNGGPNDRTGPHYEAGLLFDLQAGHFAAALRAGAMRENAAGKEQNEQGLSGSLLTRLRLAAWTFGVTLAYEYRNYRLSSFGRNDHLVQPGVQAAYALTETFSVLGSYLFIANQSSQNVFGYVRHLGELGVEATW